MSSGLTEGGLMKCPNCKLNYKKLEEFTNPKTGKVEKLCGPCHVVIEAAYNSLGNKKLLEELFIKMARVDAFNRARDKAEIAKLASEITGEPYEEN